MLTTPPSTGLRSRRFVDGGASTNAAACRVVSGTPRPSARSATAPSSTPRAVAGQAKRYFYPRWQFANASAETRELCCWALDLVDIAWRQSNPRVISVSRREAVAALDALIGAKS